MAGANDASASRRISGPTRKQRARGRMRGGKKRKQRGKKRKHGKKKNRKSHETERVTTTQQPIRQNVQENQVELTATRQPIEQRDQMITSYNQVCGCLNVSDHNIRPDMWVS